MMKSIREIKSRVDKCDKIVLVHGNFNVMHPGHLRLLKFAKDNGDFLVVAIKGTDENIELLPANERLESLTCSVHVDYAFILNEDILEFIRQLKPSVIVKGNEHEGRYNLEETVLKTYGGKLIFSSGDIKFSSFKLLQNEFEYLEFGTIRLPYEYIERHKINNKRILSILNTFSKLNVLVIGDTIVDEYKTCEPLGMSQEDPTIVVTPISSDLFLGGAGIVAAHASGIGANVDFFTVLGDDEYNFYVKDKLKEYHVNMYTYTDSSRPTTLKQRFRANNKTLLRVNNLKQHHISIDVQDMILFDIERSIQKKDLIVFSDFSYGCLPQRMITKITELGLKYNVAMVADSQSSSQIGDISKFGRMYLVTPTEREARLSVNDFESGLIILAEKLRKKIKAKNVFITLGAEGVLIHANKNAKLETNGNGWLTDQIPALNNVPKDVAGAGDSLLISSAMALVAGANMLESAFIGSLATACQVGRVGNIPLNIEEIKQELKL